MISAPLSAVFMMILVIYALASVLWTAPSATARGTPSGLKIPDGYQSKITILAGGATMSLFEKTTKPPGGDVGEPIEQTTMFNTRWRTFKMRQLITLTPTTYKCAYDPAVIDTLVGVAGTNTTITQSWFDGSTVAYFGALQKWEFDEMEEGKQPMVTITLVPTNVDPSTGAEAGPVVSSVSGS